ncbi:MAG: hypothetical protein UY50_C0030G0003 [Parcubacteria group bacterium GW2011_GWA2_49_9]|nr:MAG: hypothetical protein UY50_C0030G0003 [Parcubacteria group bacterium GW2011_GWA2_49_9]
MENALNARLEVLQNEINLLARSDPEALEKALKGTQFVHCLLNTAHYAGSQRMEDRLRDMVDPASYLAGQHC